MTLKKYKYWWKYEMIIRDKKERTNTKMKEGLKGKEIHRSIRSHFASTSACLTVERNQRREGREGGMGKKGGMGREVERRGQGGKRGREKQRGEGGKRGREKQAGRDEGRKEWEGRKGGRDGEV